MGRYREAEAVGEGALSPAGAGLGAVGLASGRAKFVLTGKPARRRQGLFLARKAQSQWRWHYHLKSRWFSSPWCRDADAVIPGKKVIGGTWINARRVAVV